jgi:hypothetical protein
VEQEERQEDREQEIKADADRLEEQGDELEGKADELDQQTGELRDEWESKQGSPDAPGAQESHDLTPDIEEDEVPESEEGSDVDPRPGTSENPGGADEGGQTTGNPPNDDSPAGDEDGDEKD